MPSFKQRAPLQAHWPLHQRRVSYAASPSFLKSRVVILRKQEAAALVVVVASSLQLLQAPAEEEEGGSPPRQEMQATAAEATLVYSQMPPSWTSLRLVEDGLPR